jgi:hypothetical protein
VPTVRGSCLCGDIAWETSEPLEFMSHCHCQRCRKAHGAAFATGAMVPADGFRLVGGGERIVRYASSPGFARPFCGRCGSVVASGDAWQGLVAVPAGSLDDDPGVRPICHIFVASKAPWFDVRDALPRFDTYPPSVDMPALPDLAPREPAAGAPRGSCLCGGVTFVVPGVALRVDNCHCSRCRKARAAAHASNLFTKADGLRFMRGEDRLASYRIPEARFFTQVFCRTCGSPMPRVDRERDVAVVPMGAFDDDPGVRPQRHIFVGSKAPWYEIADDLPQHAELPPRA